MQEVVRGLLVSIFASAAFYTHGDEYIIGCRLLLETFSYWECLGIDMPGSLAALSSAAGIFTMITRLITNFRTVSVKFSPFLYWIPTISKHCHRFIFTSTRNVQILTISWYLKCHLQLGKLLLLFRYQVCLSLPVFRGVISSLRAILVSGNMLQQEFTRNNSSLNVLGKITRN